jgi:hypothetical protein
MNQRGINLFTETCNRKAYGDQAMVGAGGAGLQFEASPQPDGSWRVRSMFMQQPAIIDRGDGKPTRIESEGVALYALDYRIGPGKDENGDPVISIEGAKVAFDF